MNKAEQQKRIRKVMIHALNAALRAGVLPLSTRNKGMAEAEYSEITVCGKPTLVNWSASGFRDLRVSVWWDYTPKRLPVLMKKRRVHYITRPLPDVGRNRFPLIVGMCASCYLCLTENEGLSLSRGGEFFSVYIRRSTAECIDQIPDVSLDG
ncbi:hypothetical protein PJ610_002443 [Salmonella enterica]|uniref:Uncharacterized protein n=1 Tax=Salmonella enterica TaxID=28901 RepID=A0A744JMB8_SALER|nr:hypothetical protein [Salmonella enterica]HAF1417173.1 hypothetical protein [Salmonella enterica]HAF2203910.1 hypothetical protein [Salmonella enterica]HAF2375733.1 hypothetical protein [Salmonella enterica]HAF2572225.1 hypothetical protein [Salmonella enterica]